MSLLPTTCLDLDGCGQRMDTLVRSPEIAVWEFSPEITEERQTRLIIVQSDNTENTAYKEIYTNYACPTMFNLP